MATLPPVGTQRVIDTIVETLSANSDVPYRATLAEAVAEFPVGAYFKSDDKGAAGPHAGALWIYQSTDTAPFYASMISATASASEINAAVAAANAAAANALNYGNAAIRSGYVAADAESWTAGAWVQVLSSDTGTHASKAGDFGASGGQTPNSGVYQEDATLGLIRKAALESGLAAAAAAAALLSEQNAKLSEIAAKLSETQGLLYRNQAQAAAGSAAQDVITLSGTGMLFATLATANAALGAIPANGFVQVLVDESQGGRRSIYSKTGGVLVLVRTLPDGAATFWVDDQIGSDTTGFGSYANPFASILKATQISLPGDRIAMKPRAGTLVVKQNVNVGAYPYRTFVGNGCIFDGYDAVAIAWTQPNAGTYPNIWKASAVYLTIGSGGAAAHGDPNKEYMGLFADDTNCLVNDPTGVASEATILTSLQAAVDYSYSQRNGPVLAGTPSGTTNGFIWGNHDLYIRMPTGVNPNTKAWYVQQRRQPAFGNGWTFETDFQVFGGWGHNGVELYEANTTESQIDIWYPSCHGSFICGLQGRWPNVHGRNRTGSAGYAYHMFNGGPKKRVTIGYGGEAHDYNGSLDRLVGGHGSNQGNDICDALILIDFVATNCQSLGSGGDASPGSTYGPLTRGAFYIRPRLYGIKSMGVGATAFVQEPTIVHTGTDSNGFCWEPPGLAGQVITVQGGSTGGSREGLFLRGISSQGTLRFVDHVIAVGGERVGSQWWQLTSAATISFENCLIEGEGTSEFANWGQTNSATVTFTDCMITGVALPTGSVRTRTQVGGDIGLLRGPRGEVVCNDGMKALAALGEEILGAAWVQNSATASYGQFHVLTQKGMYSFGLDATGGTGLSAPNWTALAGYNLTGLAGVFKVSVANWVVAYGKDQSGNAVILRYNVNDGKTAAPTAADLTTLGLLGKTITCAVSGLTAANNGDGKIWFGCSDGTIIAYDASTNGVTAPASGVTYPLRGGVRNGNTVIMCGSDSAGTTGTVGGAVVSTDVGVTWAETLKVGDSTPAGIGAWAVRCTRAAFRNGLYFLFGARGMMLTSTTGAANSWTSQTLKADVDVRHVASDPNTNQILVGGYPGRGQEYRGQRLFVIDVSGTPNPAALPIRAVQSPVSQIGALLVGIAPQGPASNVNWVVCGKLRQVAISEDPRGGWRRAEWPSPMRALYTPTMQLLPAMLALN